MSRLVPFSMVLLAAAVTACSSEPSPSGATTGHTTAATAATTAATATAATPTATATAAATAEPAPRSDCPKGSAGPGTITAPCEAKGGSRMMEVTWTGKMDDKGPTFRVVNKSELTILYGKVAIYFYDKAGKQLDPKEGDKSHHNHVCLGNLFAGVMKPGEKAVITFSCVGKNHVPDDAKFIEAEMQTVGFADASERKSEFYWRNNDLVPDTRPKGGVK